MACQELTAVAFDFEFVSSSGFNAEPDEKPVLQLAYSYTAMVEVGSVSPPPSPDCSSAHCESDTGADPNADVPSETLSQAATDGGGFRSRVRSVRRLRVQTITVPVARSSRQLLENVNERAMMTLLTHKVRSPP